MNTQEPSVLTLGNPGLHRRAFLRFCLPVLVVAGVLAAGLPAWALEEDDDDEEDLLPSFLRIRREAAPATSLREAQESPWRTFELAGGAAYTSLTSTLTMTHGIVGAGLAVDAEDVLGMQRELWSPDAWTSLRIGNRHRLKFHYSDLTRTADRALQATITINGFSISAGTEVHSIYGVQQFDLSYIWSFLKDDRMEIGLTLHVDVIRLHLAVDATNIGRSENERWLLPIPLPGFDADFILVKDLWLRLQIGAAYLPLTNFTGLIIEETSALEWSFLKNLSVGVGFQFYKVELRKNTEDGILGNFEGKFRFDAGGILFYLNFHL